MSNAHTGGKAMNEQMKEVIRQVVATFGQQGAIKFITRLVNCGEGQARIVIREAHE
jgi:hypothetical protein